MTRVDELMFFLNAGNSYEDAAGLCHEWGVQTSETAVHDWFTRRSLEWSLERARAAAAATGKLPSFEKEIRRLNEQRVFESMANPATSQKVHVAIYALEIEKAKLELATRSAETRFKLETEKLEVSKRRVAVLEAKIKSAAKEVRKAANAKGGITPETLKAIEEKLLL